MLAERSLPVAGLGVHEQLLAAVDGLIAELADEVGERPVAVGLGCPGLVDRERGIARFLPNLPGDWRDVALSEPLGRSLGIPVYLLNDARLACLGELCFGTPATQVASSEVVASQPARPSFVLLTLGTGVGGGVVVDGRLLLGPAGAAGEVGHMIVEPEGAVCGCGSHGCLETVASGPALVGEAVRLLRSGQAPILRSRVGGRVELVDPEQLGLAVREGDADIAAVIRRAGRALGIAVTNLITVLHPQRIVLAGGVAGLGELLLDPIRSVVHERVRLIPLDQVRIEISALGEKAGILGALVLASRRGRV